MAVPDSPNNEERICAGCANSVESADLRQLVVSFGNALWHPECFRCAKCNKLVDGGSSLLLLSDGNPLCSDCTFTCGVCHKSIIDEAITTGNDAYHADCFKCRACREPIQEVVFAKTRDAVFCMACHNIRIARSRKKQEMRARQREASGDSHHRSHRDRSREGHSSRREKEPVPPIPQTNFTRSNSSPAPETESGQAESPVASQADITCGTKRLSIIHSTAQGIPPPPLSPRKAGAPSSPNRLHPNSPRTFPSELYSAKGGNSRTSSASPRNSYFPPHSGGSSYPDSLSPTWQQTQHKDRHSSGSSPRSPTFNQQQQLQPPQGRKEGRRSFNPLDAIIDGMERPYTPRTKNLGNSGSRLASQDGGYEDTSGDGIPDALKEYFKEVVEIEDPRQRWSPVSNGHLTQPRSFFDTPTPSLIASSAAPSVNPTPEPSSYRSTPRSAPSGVTPAPSEQSDAHTRNAPSISSSRRQFEAYDGLAEEDPPPPLPVQPQQQPQQEHPSNYRPTISPQAWLGSPSRSRPSTANKDPNNSIFGQLRVYPPPPSTASSTGHHDGPLRTPTDPYAPKPKTPKTPTTPLSADGVIRPPPPSIPHNVTSEGEGETETESDVQSPMVHGIEGPLVLSPTHLPLAELAPEDLTPVDGNGNSGAGGGGLGEQTTSNKEGGASHQAHQGSVSGSSQLEVPGVGPSPPPPLREESSTASQNRYHNQDGSPPSSSHSQNGLRKKRKHDERPPALPPIRISQFYVDSPTAAARGGIEVTQVMDDSVNSSEGGKKDGMESLVEEGEDHYVLVPPHSADGKMSASTTSTVKKGGEKERDSRGSHGSPSGTPTVVIEEHQESVYTPTTSDQSHDTSMSATATSQTSVSSAGLASSRTHSSGSVDTAATHTSQTVVEHNSQGGKSVTRSQSKSSKRSRSDHGHGGRGGSASGIQEDEVYDVVLRSLSDLIENATKHDKSVVKLDLKFVEVIKKTIKSERAKYEELKGNLESMKRESLHFAAGLSASQQEYDRELATRRDAQTEVRRLRVLVQEQTAKLSALTGEQRKRDMLEKNSKEMSCNLAGLEKEMSKLKVERDMTMAEMEELKSPISAGLDSSSFEATGTRLSKALSVRFDGIKSQYKRQLEPLTERREALRREIDDLAESRKAILEETAALHARNEELMGLNSQIARDIENAIFQQAYEQQPPSPTPPPPPPSNTKQFSASTSSNATYVEENSRTLKGRPLESSEHNRGGLFKWSKNREVSTPSRGDSSTSSPLMNGFQKMAKHIPHAFQQMALLKVSRCDHCKDKMWGTQSRCQGCGISVHPRCAIHLKGSCSGSNRDDGSGTVFGRDLIEQVKLDARDSDRLIPVIVERCIQAIEVIAMDYEGLYRKSGGSGQVKIIEGLFEKGNYEAIDLLDSSVTSDISSVTSVLKSYFRELPNPLMTSTLHESFIDALTIKDQNSKVEAVTSLLNQLPKEHYATLKLLMLHLNQVQAHKTENRMDSKNLGLIFGPTLMRSADMTREFGDMAGKTQTIELLVDYAPTIFRS